MIKAEHSVPLDVKESRILLQKNPTPTIHKFEQVCKKPVPLIR